MPVETLKLMDQPTYSDLDPEHPVMETGIG